MLGYRSLPDPDLNLRDASDFVLGSRIARHALQSSWSGIAVVTRDLVEAIHRLVQSCHMPEFTDHGLTHLCSLIDRISRWSCSDGALLADKLTQDEAAVLLLATLLHDLGMLSQKPEDMPDDAMPEEDIARWADLSVWVRRTHVRRLPKLATRVLAEIEHPAVCHDQRFQAALGVACAHEQWPWEWSGNWITPKNRALASVVASADLLDEGSARCDTVTLMRHRNGTELNTSHWLRHCLIRGRLLVEQGCVNVEMVKPPETGSGLSPVYGALRNQFRLLGLYRQDLQILAAEVSNVTLHPSTGVPLVNTPSLDGWQDLSGFANEDALCVQLLKTFMPEALKDKRRFSSVVAKQLLSAGLEDVDLTLLEAVSGQSEPRAEEEETFNAIVGDQRDAFDLTPEISSS